MDSALAQVWGLSSRRHTLKQMRIVFLTWKQTVSQQRQRRALVIAHIRRRCTKSVGDIFQAWRGQAQNRRVRESLINRIRAHRGLLLLGAAFRRWRDTTLDEKRRRLLLQRVLARLLHRQLFKGWSQWQRFSRVVSSTDDRLGQLWLKHQQHRRLRRYWVTWRSSFSTSVAKRQAMLRVINRFASSTKAGAMSF
jgi:hypothetical protein